MIILVCDYHYKVHIFVTAYVSNCLLSLMKTMMCSYFSCFTLYYFTSGSQPFDTQGLLINFVSWLQATTGIGPQAYYGTLNFNLWSRTTRQMAAVHYHRLRTAAVYD